MKISRMAWLLPLLLAANWPQFRGPNGSGVSDDKTLPVKWSATENVVWKSEIIGRGVSCPVVYDGRIYITSNTGIRRDRLHVLCYDLKEGKQLWHRQMAATGNTGCHPTSEMAAPTPVVNEEGVFALFATGDLVAFDKDGNLKWYRSLVGDYPTIGNQVGMASSPVLWKDFILVPMDNDGDSFLAAIDTHYGKNVWKMPRPKESNWGTPTVRAVGDKAEVLFQSRTDLTAYDVVTGTKKWDYKIPGASIPSPVVADGKILVPTRGLACIDPANEKPTQVWQSTKLSSGAMTPLYYQQKIFTITGAGVLVCADIKKGDVLWQERVKGKYWASPIAGDGKVYTFNEKGLTTVVQIAQDKGEILAENDLGEEILGTPAIVDGTLIIRTDKHLYRIGKKQ